MNRDKVVKSARRTVIELQSQRFTVEETIAFMSCLTKVYGFKKKSLLARLRDKITRSNNK